MVRAPCCEKMGLKKGPWTTEEDQILIAFIQRYGHGNWRALPKQAGLLRCGKSCRLRWTNYLRPDIKRGNFSEEEEETIIKLHEMLGNRWSTIAARLPGRTDNEIKNVWHTHLKKKLKQKQATPDTKPHYSMETSQCESNTKRELSEPMNFPTQSMKGTPGYVAVSPQRASSDSSSVTDSSVVTIEKHDMGAKDDYSFEIFQELDENFWSEALSEENFSMQGDFQATTTDSRLQSPSSQAHMTFDSNNFTDDSMDFWYNLLMKAAELPELE